MNSVKKGHLMELPNRVLIGYDIIEEFGNFLIDLGIDKSVLFVGGKNVKDVTQSSLSQQDGMVLQEPFLFSQTVFENIRYNRLSATN